MNIFRVHKQPATKNQKGFTLIEILLVMGLMSIMLIVLTDMFTSVLDVRTESEANSGVTEDGRFLLSRLAYDVRRADSVTTPENLDVQISSVTDTSATIGWTTATASDSQIEYGTTPSYGNSTTLDPSLVTSHSANLSGLSANTTYNFRVLSRGADNNLTASANYTFVTGGGGGSGAITHVQTSGVSNDSDANTISRAFSSNVTAGNLLVASVSWGDSFSLSCSDTLGNTYAIATSQHNSTNNQSLGICYTISSTGGPNTVTASFAPGAPYRRIIINEYSGIAWSSPADVTASNIAVSNPINNLATSTSATTTVDGDLIFGAVMNDDPMGPTTIAAGSGFTQRNSLNNKDLAVQDRVQTTAASVASTQTFGASRSYLAQMVAFKASTGGGGSTEVPPMLGATSSKMSLTIGGELFTYTIVDGNLQLINSLGTNVLNSSRSDISNLTFQRLGNINGRELVRLSLTVTSKARPDQGPISKTFTTTIGRR